MADVVNTNQFKNGMHIEVDGAPWRIVEFQHVKPGKGGAFVRTKLKALESGAVVDKTFRAGEKFNRVHTEVKNVQYRAAADGRPEARWRAAAGLCRARGRGDRARCPRRHGLERDEAGQARDG